MANSIFLVSTLITGMLLVLVTGYVLQERPRTRPRWTRNAARESGVSVTGAGATVPRWAVAAALAALFVLGVGVTVGAAPGTGVVSVFIGGLAGLVGIYLVWGVYHIARTRGMQYSQAVGIGAWVLGLLLLGGIVARLVLGG